MYTGKQTSLALEFAQSLANRDYLAAYGMLDQSMQANMSVQELQRQFEQMIPLDWGEVDPIELQNQGNAPFIYIVLGGDVYSEAIIINEFSRESDTVKISGFEFGRP
jgi:hypothetical protein